METFLLGGKLHQCCGSQVVPSGAVIAVGILVLKHPRFTKNDYKWSAIEIPLDCILWYCKNSTEVNSVNFLPVISNLKSNSC